MAFVQIPGGRIGELVHRDVEEGDVDIAALARCARRRAAPPSSANAMVMPVMKSTIDRPMRVGGLSGSPVRCRKPASACIR